MLDELGRVIARISLATSASTLLVHPRNHTKSALRAEMEFLQQFSGLHRNGNSCRIIDGSSAKVPGVEMSGDHNDLFGMLTPLQIGDHVVADRVWKFLRREREMHADFSLGGEGGDEISIFCGDSAGGEDCRKDEAGVRPEVNCSHH